MLDSLVDCRAREPGAFDELVAADRGSGGADENSEHLLDGLLTEARLRRGYRRCWHRQGA